MTKLTDEQLLAAFERAKWGCAFTEKNPLLVALRAVADAAVQTELPEAQKLLSAIKYIVGIAERGEGRQMRADESAEQFVLGYVKRIESAVHAAPKPTCQKCGGLGYRPTIHGDSMRDVPCPFCHQDAVQAGEHLMKEFHGLPTTIFVDGKTRRLSIEFDKTLCYICYTTGYHEDRKWPVTWAEDFEKAVDRMCLILIELNTSKTGE